ncbi:MAG: TonB-dependent receptor [Cyclobacteriaceae bacterium]|nr:TonB-dependent receptor [Cyclobacteriaceae bacterium]
MKKLVMLIVCIVSFLGESYSQTVTQTVKGRVTDQGSQEGLIGATVMLLGSDPLVGTSTDLEGSFELKNVPVGRQSFEFRIMGYEPYVVREILVSSGKEVVLEIALKEDITSLEEVVVVYKGEKDKAINEMAAVSSRQFTVEETQRYAGGLNDPARLVSSFAGVATPSISSNGISVRGNNPAGLLWRVEGVEVPSPNHFADLTIAGAGLLTVLSSQVMSNSDFYTGAFPAEYGNASSGVFDINLRTGNSDKRENTLQAGILGVDFATEGPFKKGNEASYLLNYRYSTMALISPLLPSDAGVLKYQDVSYKVKLPTKKAGTFSLWGIGAYDGIDTEASDSTEWKTRSDRENSQTSLYMFASGLNHRVVLKPTLSLNSSLAFSGNGLSFKEQYLDDNFQEHLQSDARKNNYKLTFQSHLKSFWGQNHTNQTGVYFNNLGYHVALDHAEWAGATPENIVDENGQSVLMQFYSQSQFNLSPKLTLNAGFHSQYFQLNEKFSFEPRLALSYQVSAKSNVALAYGLHGKTESLPLYFIKDEWGNQPNKELELMKSNHVVLSLNTMLTDNLRLSIEPYYQYLNDVPVSPDSYISTLNTRDILFFNHVLVSEGTGINRGVDFTLERYLSNGLYYLLTTSVFDSRYTARDGVERNTRFNKNYVANALIGKEWQVGRNKNNTFSANFRLNYLGGNRIESIDEAASLVQQEVVYGETNGAISFQEKYQDTPIVSFTLSYRINKPNHSSVWALQVLNATQTKELESDIYNTVTGAIEQKYTKIMVPNLSYKIEF